MSSNEIAIQNDKYQELIHKRNEQDRNVGFNEQPLSARLDGTSFAIYLRGSAEPLARFDAMPVQVIYTRKTRGLYDPFNRDARAQLCSSRDGNIHGEPRPDTLDRLNELQGELAKLIEASWEPMSGKLPCNSCLFDQWGTKWTVIKGRNESHMEVGPGRACGERRLLVFLHPDFNRPISISLSFTSARQWDAYADSFTIKKPERHFSEFSTVMTVKKQSNQSGTMSWEQVQFAKGTELDKQAVLVAAQMSVPFMQESAVGDLIAADETVGNGKVATTATTDAEEEMPI